MVSILTILLFGVPLMISAIKKKIFKEFSLGQLTRVFNRSFITQVLIALISILSMSYLEKKYYSNGQISTVTDIWMETGVAYLIIGTFFYIPGLIILNFVNLIVKKKGILIEE